MRTKGKTERKGGRRDPHHGAEFRGHSRSMGRRRSERSAAAAPSSRAPMAAAVRVSSGARASATGSWGLGLRALPFIGVRGESLACAPRRPRRGETRSDSGSARVPVGRGEADWTGRGEWADGAPWAAGGKKKKEKERDGGVGRMGWKPRE